MCPDRENCWNEGTFDEVVADGARDGAVDHGPPGQAGLQQGEVLVVGVALRETVVRLGPFLVFPAVQADGLDEVEDAGVAPAKVAFVLLLVEEDRADQVHGQHVDAEGRDGEADGRQDEGQVDVLALVVEDAVVSALQGNDGAVQGEEQRRLHDVVAEHDSDALVQGALQVLG